MISTPWTAREQRKCDNEGTDNRGQRSAANPGFIIVRHAILLLICWRNPVLHLSSAFAAPV
jgi:hypothetical protein